MVKYKQRIFLGKVKKLSPEEIELRWIVGVGCVSARILKLVGHVISGFHPCQVPQVACSLPVLDTANSVPVTRGVHALAAIVSCRPELFRPEELLARLIDQHRVVSNAAAIVIQIVRTFGFRVIGRTIYRQISLMKNRELVLVQMLVLGEIRAGSKFDP